MEQTKWRTIDFRPAASGWFVVYIDESEGTPPGVSFKDPLAGWLVQEDPNGDRRVVAAKMDEDDGAVVEVASALFLNNTLCFQGPGQVPPTSQEVATELRYRQVQRDLYWKRQSERENEQWRARKVAA